MKTECCPLYQSYSSGQRMLVCHGAKESLEQDLSGTLKNELQGWEVGKSQQPLL